MKRSKATPMTSAIPKPSTVATVLKSGCAVANPEGRIGVVIEINYPKATVAFGSGGPCYDYNWKDLRQVTRKEINEAGLDGVGCYALGEEP